MFFLRFRVNSPTTLTRSHCQVQTANPPCSHPICWSCTFHSTRYLGAFSDEPIIVTLCRPECVQLTDSGPVEKNLPSRLKQRRQTAGRRGVRAWPVGGRCSPSLGQQQTREHAAPVSAAGRRRGRSPLLHVLRCRPCPRPRHPVRRGLEGTTDYCRYAYHCDSVPIAELLLQCSRICECVRY